VMAAITDCANRSEYGHVAIAKELGLGVRTLQRRIAEHGTTLRALVERVREANAVAFLDNPALSIDEVAILLGYTHERAFRRAFERWQGQSPAAFRRARSP
ncbi:MAG: helix-turn-helix transcriptional regulator, partial [Myxococcota bacterium]